MTLAFTVASMLLTLGHASHNAQTQAKHAPSPNTKRITLTLEDGDIRAGFIHIFESVGASYVIHPSVAGRATVRFRNVPFGRALSALLRASSQKLQLRFDGSIYLVEREQDGFNASGGSFGSGIGPQGGRPIKLQVNFARAAEIAARIRKLPMFAPEGGSRIEVHAPDNTLLVTMPYDDLVRELKEQIRLLDIAPHQTELTVRVVATSTNPAGKKSVQVWQTSCMGSGGSETNLTQSLDAGGAHVSMKASPVVNGDASTSLDASFAVDAPVAARGAPKQTMHARFTGRWRILDQTTTLLHTSSSPGATLQVFVTPMVRSQFGYWLPAHGLADLQAVIVLDPPVQQYGVSEPLQRLIVDSVAAGMSQSPPFEVVNREELGRTAASLGLSSPSAIWNARMTIAKNLAANLVVTCESMQISSQVVKDRKIVTVRLNLRIEAVGQDEELSGTDSVASALVGPEGEEAATKEAAIKAAGLAIEDLKNIRQGTVLSGGVNPVVLELGASNGIRPGDSALVLREGQVIGRIVVETVHPTYSTARAVTAPKGIGAEDRVLFPSYGTSLLLRPKGVRIIPAGPASPTTTDRQLIRP
jgi:hypothetical protein